MKYGLSGQQLQEITGILGGYDEIEAAVLFGSRVMDTWKEASDVDIAIKGEKADLYLAARLKAHFEEETYLPFFFDVIAWNTITSEALKKQIRSKGKVIYRKGMEEWRQITLGDAITLQRGRDLPKTKMIEGPIPVAGSNGIIGWHNKSTTNAIGVTIGRSGNLGNAYLYKQDFWAHNTTLYVKDFKGNDEIFIFYFLKFLDFERFNVGSAVPTLNRNHIHPMPITLPPLAEQKAIAKVLSSLDDKIDLLHRQNKTLESLAETLFRQWFIQEAKEDWESVKIADVANVTIGRTPPRKEKEWFSKSAKNMKWVSIKDMAADGVYLCKTSECLTDAAVKKFKIPIISAGTTILSFKMTVGRVAITAENMLSNEAIAHFEIKNEDLLNAEFLYLFFKNFNFAQLGTTSTIVTAINSQMIKELPLVLPDRKTFAIFKEAVQPYFQKIRANQFQIQTLENLCDLLLPKLMSGEVHISTKDV